MTVQCCVSYALVMKHTVTVELNLPEGKTLGECSNTELADAMSNEVREFDRWFSSLGNEPLTRLERSTIKTYMAWKILPRDGDKVIT